jgi:hypothetical protein
MSTTPNGNDVANLWFWAYLAAATRAATSFYAAPRNLEQSILPWTFAGIVVNETNSTDPVAERAILSRESYGRQLGRISDALVVLISQLPDDEKSKEPIADFLNLKARIDGIKHELESAHADRILEKLKRLKERDGTSFQEFLERVTKLA